MKAAKCEMVVGIVATITLLVTGKVLKKDNLRQVANGVAAAATAVASGTLAEAQSGGTRVALRAGAIATVETIVGSNYLRYYACVVFMYGIVALMASDLARVLM